MQKCEPNSTTVGDHVWSAANYTASNLDHIFAKSELFNSWNLYICFLSVLVNLLGNPLIIAVIYKTPGMHNFPHYLFVNLAASDVAIGVSSIGSFVVRETLTEGATIVPLDWVCKFVHTCPIPAVSLVVSSLTLMVITCERFYHISQPFKSRVAQHSTKLIVGLIWAGAVIIVIPVIIYTKFDRRKRACDIVVPHMAVYVIVITFIAFILPFSVMSYCYYKTVMILWFSETDSRLAHIPTNRTALKKHRKTVVKFLGVVIASFFLCSVPVALVLVAKRYVTVPNSLFFSTILLAMFSSSVNPVIFMVQNRQFRVGLKTLISKRNGLAINPRILARVGESSRTSRT